MDSGTLPNLEAGVRGGALRRWKALLLGIGLLALAIQVVPVDRENPPVTGEADSPTEVEAVLRRACYDCHSHETRWPWYGYVAPVSWLLEHDVKEGREHLNLSRWDAYAPGKRVRLFKEIREEVDLGAMPPWYYVSLHPSARLSPEDFSLLRRWVDKERRK